MTTKTMSVVELSQNEIGIISGGKRCAVNNLYKWATKTSQAFVTAYCLLRPQPIGNVFLHNILNNPRDIDLAQRTLCAAIANGIIEIVDYFIGNWFECADTDSDKK